MVRRTPRIFLGKTRVFQEIVTCAVPASGNAAAQNTNSEPTQHFKTQKESAHLFFSHLFVDTFENGITTVLESGSQYKEIAKNKLEGKTLASIAVSQGNFFIRSGDTLFCIGPPPRRPSLASGVDVSKLTSPNVDALPEADSNHRTKKRD